jgi:hypothetical protein
MSARSCITPCALSTAVRHDVIEQQLDNINVLAEALAMAIRDGDSENEAKLRVSLARSVAAFRWGASACLPGILAYANVRSDSDDDLFAPAFILTSTAPDQPDTLQLVAQVSDDVRALLARVV